MNSRERVLTALRHQEPDRLPIDFGGMRSTGIAAQAYEKLRKHLGIEKGKTRIYDIMQGLAEPEEGVLKILRADVIQLHRLRPAFNIKLSDWKIWRGPDGVEYEVPGSFNPQRASSGGWEIREGNIVLGKAPSDGFLFDPAYFPLANAKDRKDIDRYFDGLSKKDLAEEMAYLAREAKKLHSETEYAILGEFGGNLFEYGTISAWGFSNFLILLTTKKALAQYFFERLTDHHIEVLKRYLPTVRDYIQIIQLGDDLGFQTGPFMRPAMYREMIKPYQKKLFQFIKENSNLYIFLHSCGAVSDFIPDLIEIGLDILNPVQISAKGMDPEKLKREFGKHLTFWGGGCDTRATLPLGTLRDIREEVKKLIRIFAPGGGYVFNQVHNILANIPPEKVIAMYEAAKNYGKYPIAI